MKHSKTTPLIICSIALAGCHATQKSTPQSTQHRENTSSYAAERAQSTTTQQRSRMKNESAQKDPRVSAAAQAAAATNKQPSDAQSAVLGTADKAILITTDDRQTFRIAPGYQTVLQIEGENLEAVDSVRIIDAQGGEVEGVRAKLQSTTNTSGTISISARRGTKVDGPLRLQVFAGSSNNSVPAPIRIKKQVIAQ